MKRIFILLKFSILFGFAVSCTETADLDPKERFVQVHAILENSDVQTINLYYTSYVSENIQLPVDEAEVIIDEYIDGAKINSYTFKCDGNGKWQSEFKPVPKAEYKLNVSVPGFNTMNSSTIYPDTLYHYKSSYEEYKNGDLGEIRKWIINVDKTDSCYIWLYYADYIPGGKGWKISDSIAVASQMSDTYPDDPYLKHHFPSGFYYDASWSSLPGLMYQDRYKRYHGPGRNETTKNIMCNFDQAGGGVNLWLYGIGYKPIVLSLTGTIYKSPHLKYDQAGSQHPNSYVMFQSVDSNYDRYLRETYAVALGLNSPESNDLTSLWDYKEVHSNITNGIGIFGCTFKLKLYLKECIAFDDPFWKAFDIEFPDYEWRDRYE